LYKIQSKRPPIERNIVASQTTVPKSKLDELDELEMRISKEYDDKQKARGWK